MGGHDSRGKPVGKGRKLNNGRKDIRGRKGEVKEGKGENGRKKGWDKRTAEGKGSG